MTQNPSTKCGFVAVLGEPNAGKSTLINQLVGQKVSIVSHKVQTTRQRILGIAMTEDAQIILIDTPGIFTPKKRLDRAMVAVAWEAGHDADVVMILVDASESNQQRSHRILSKAVESIKDNQKLFLILNKVDVTDKPKLLDLATEFGKYDRVDHLFMISALTGDGIKELQAKLSAAMPESPWLFPEDQISDLPQRLWASEITREQIYHKLHQELPYETYVETETWEEFENGDVKIRQVIFVNRDGQKSIVLGRKGQMIKSISQAARMELSHLLERPVHLFLHVKVAENWAERSGAYRLMGLEFHS